jgi:hypothetical protein
VCLHNVPSCVCDTVVWSGGGGGVVSHACVFGRWFDDKWTKGL